MKKLLYILLSAAVAFSLASCGKADSKQISYSKNGSESDTFLAIYEVNDSTSIFQFNINETASGNEFANSYVYALTFSKSDKGAYVHEGIDQSGEAFSLKADFAKNGTITVSGDGFLSNLYGKFSPADTLQDIDDQTILAFLRSVEAAGIENFGLVNPYDTMEVYLAGDWFNLCALYSEGNYVDSFLVAKDFSAVVRLSASEGDLIYGNFDNMFNATVNYTYLDENNAPYEVSGMLVTPAVYGGTTLLAGDTAEVFIIAPYDLTRSVNVKSGNASVVTANGCEITAVAPGTATLTVEADYCGTVKEFELEVEVIESLDGDSFSDDYVAAEYEDSKYATYYDKESQRAIMEICQEDNMISVDILWSDDAYTTHHWSYVGSENPYGGLFELSGRLTIDTTDDDGFFSEEVIAEDIAATLTLAPDNCFYWYDALEDTDHGCIFELPLW